MGWKKFTVLDASSLFKGKEKKEGADFVHTGDTFAENSAFKRFNN